MNRPASWRWARFYSLSTGLGLSAFGAITALWPGGCRGHVADQALACSATAVQHRESSNTCWHIAPQLTTLHG